MIKSFVLFLFLLFFGLSVWVNPIFAYTPAGNYLQLNGGYARTIVPAPIVPSSVTFEFWVKPQSVSGVQNIISIGDQSVNWPYYEIGINGGALSVSYVHGVNNFVISNASISSVSLVANQWNHIGVIFSNQVSMYINGIIIHTPVSSSGIYRSFGPNIILGASYTENPTINHLFKGDIDELRISSTVRDVSGLWNQGFYNGPLTGDSGTMLLWHFDGIRGQENELDSSGKNINGILLGGDSLIHYFGVIPTPTPFTLTMPSINWVRPVLPTLFLPRLISSISPTVTPQQGGNIEPTVAQSIRDIRIPRPTTRSLVH
jgi:hypothetical protein